MLSKKLRIQTTRRVNRYTVHQISALIALFIFTIWGLASLWLHLVSPAGTNRFEMTYLGTLTATSLILLPLYWRRIGWAYIGGILLALAMLAGAGKAIFDQSLIFSWSLYNLSVILAYAAGLACAYFSLRSYRDLAPVGWRRTVLGTGSIVAAAAIIAAILGLGGDLIQRTKWQWTLSRIDNRLQKLETLDEQIEFLLDQGDIDSAAVGIVVDDGLVWANAYGGANLDTVYNIGSITKPFVATAILQLYERGLIDLDDDVNEALPFDLRHPEYPNTPITILMLLTHQSGLGHFTESYYSYHTDAETVTWLENRGWQLPSFDPRPPFAEFIEGYLTPGGAHYASGAWRAAEPGTEYGYSTPGYDILAYLVECVTGQPFEEYARENILDPLGMTSSGFSVAEFPGRVATPYERIAGVLSKTNVELPIADVQTVGGGGMLSTAVDMAQYVIAQMNQGQVNGVQLLEPETVALMQEEAVTFPLGRGDLNQVAYGLGLGHVREQPWNCWGHLYDMHGATGHGGSWFGYTGQMWFVGETEGGYGIVLLANTEFDFNPEARGLWLFASPLRLQTLLMQEASTLYQQAHTE
jgi:CubicO group peptidase (beta-lactamase class C family)